MANITWYIPTSSGYYGDACGVLLVAIIDALEAKLSALFANEAPHLSVEFRRVQEVPQNLSEWADESHHSFLVGLRYKEQRQWPDWVSEDPLVAFLQHFEASIVKAQRFSGWDGAVLYVESQSGHWVLLDDVAGEIRLEFGGDWPEIQADTNDWRDWLEGFDFVYVEGSPDWEALGYPGGALFVEQYVQTSGMVREIWGHMRSIESLVAAMERQDFPQEKIAAMLAVIAARTISADEAAFMESLPDGVEIKLEAVPEGSYVALMTFAGEYLRKYPLPAGVSFTLTLTPDGDPDRKAYWLLGDQNTDAQNWAELAAHSLMDERDRLKGLS